MTLNIAIKGGLGNQLFQYAFGTYLQRTYKCTVCYDVIPLQEKGENLTPRPYLLDKLFPITNYTEPAVHRLFYSQNDPFVIKMIKRMIRSLKSYAYVGEHIHALPVLNSKNIYYLDGYWQSRAYATEILTELNHISKKFKVPAQLSSLIDNVGSVAVHVRRGDYVSNPFINSYHGLCDLSYFNKAIAYLEKEKQTSAYFIFSDDIAWAKENIKVPKPVHFIEGNTAEPFEDLFLMKLCHNMILSNSSFSCWAAYLNSHSDRTVIVPENWTSKHKTKELPLFDKSWTVL